MKIILLIPLVFLTSCTYVEVDLTSQKATVLTFMTARQDVVIERLADGTVRWSTKKSDPETQWAQSILNMTEVVAKTAGVQ